MRWQGLKSKLKADFAESVRDRVDINVTRYHSQSRRSSGWTSVDGKDIARACDWLYTRGNGRDLGRIGTSSGLFPRQELDAYDFKISCWELAHNGPDQALLSENPICRALAVLHRKVGRNRVMRVLEQEGATPIEIALANLRAESEGWIPNSSLNTDGHPDRRLA